MIDNGYVPFISRMHWSWTILLSALTAGLFPLHLALYLSWWVHRRRGAGISIYLYSAIAILLLIACIPSIEHINPRLLEEVVTAALVAWIAVGFLLRNELRSQYGKEFEINPLLTTIFSVYYLNYCLWAIGDGV
jgi:hypothetical protein